MSLTPTTSHRHRAVLAQDFGDGAAETAIDVVLFGGDDGAGFPGAVDQQVAVDRLDGMDVDHPRPDALVGEDLGGFQRLDQHVAGGDDGQVAAFTQRHALADLELVGGLVEHHRYFGAREAQVDRPLELRNGAGRQFGLDRVGDRNDGHVRQRAHEGDVGDRVVAGAIIGIGQSGVGAR